MTAWDSYWAGLREDQWPYREQAREFVARLDDALDLRRDDRVLDFGSGFGHVAAGLARLVAEVWYWDGSEHMRRRAGEVLADEPNARLLDLSDPDRPSPSDAVPVDLVIVNSVVQYMAPDEIERSVGRWARLLAPGGRLVISDLISPEASTLGELDDLLRFAAYHRFLARAAHQAVLEVTYWRTRRDTPLTRVDPDQLRSWAKQAGLSLEVLPRNLTHLTHRYAAVLRSE